jgi:hypothetical protein
MRCWPANDCVQQSPPSWIGTDAEPEYSTADLTTLPHYVTPRLSVLTYWIDFENTDLPVSDHEGMHLPGAM